MHTFVMHTKASPRLLQNLQFDICVRHGIVSPLILGRFIWDIPMQSYTRKQASLHILEKLRFDRSNAKWQCFFSPSTTHIWRSILSSRSYFMTSWATALSISLKIRSCSARSTSTVWVRSIYIYIYIYIIILYLFKIYSSFARSSACMWVCMCVYVCVCVCMLYVSTYVCMYTRMFWRSISLLQGACVCVYVCVCVCVCVCMCV